MGKVPAQSGVPVALHEIGVVLAVGHGLAPGLECASGTVGELELPALLILPGEVVTP